jgi:hypothetical protein
MLTDKLRVAWSRNALRKCHLACATILSLTESIQPPTNFNHFVTLNRINSQSTQTCYSGISFPLLEWSSTTKPLNWLVFPIPENQGKGNQTHKRKEKLIKRKREEKNNDNWQLSAPDIGRHDLQTDIPGKCYVKSLEFFSLRMAAQTETLFDFIFNLRNRFL